MSPAARLLVAGCLAMVVVMGIGRFYYTPMLPLMQREYGFDAAIAGLIASANFAGYLFGSIAASMFGPGVTRLRVFRLALVGSVATTAAMGLTDSIPVWIALRTLSGVSSALAMIAGAGIVAEALSKVDEPGRIGWYFGGAGLGIFVSGMLAQVAGGSLDTSQMWLLAGGIGVLMVPFIFRELVERELQLRPHRASANRRQPRPLRLWPLFVNYSCEGLGYSVFATFIVAIVKARPETEAIGDWVWVVVGLAGLPSALFWTAIAERIGFAVSLILAYAVQIVGVLLPAISGSGIAALVAAVMFGGTFMAISALTLPLGRHGAGGRGFAVLTAGFGAGQMIGPAIAGYMVTLGYGFEAALYGSAAVLAFGLLVLIYAVITRSDQPEAVAT